MTESIKKILRKNYINIHFTNEDISKLATEIAENYKLCVNKITNRINKYKTYISDNVFVFNKPSSLNNDDLNEEQLKNAEQLNILLSVKYPEQRSPEWYKQRETRLTASDGATIIGQNKYEPFYNYYKKKLQGYVFKGNEACYHGTKFERIIILQFQHRNNVILHDFGLVCHPTIPFLGASPDSIVSHYKLDGISKTNMVGTMIEIKCPLTRPIKSYGQIKGGICPIYYWIQVQIQLQCCNLTRCRFVQCKINEYSEEQYINDLKNQERLSCGVFIQMLPKDKYELINEDKSNYNEIVYEYSKFIYPDKLLNYNDNKIWLENQIIPDNMVFDRYVYWNISVYTDNEILRDDEWFNDNIDKYKKTWDYIEYFKQNRDEADKFFKFIDENQNEEDIKEYLDNLKI